MPGAIAQPTQKFKPLAWAWFPEFLLLAPTAGAQPSQAPWPGGFGGHRGGTGGDSLLCGHAGRRALCLGELVGYHPPVRPAGETDTPGLSCLESTLPALALARHSHDRRSAQRLVGLYLRPRGGGPRDGRRDRRLPSMQGQIRPRVPLIKIVASAITIGSGGSGGREGPIAQIGAGFGSLLANLLRLGGKDRRILVAAGMGAGIAAIFRAPLAGRLVCRGSALLFSGVRAGSDHARSDRQRRFVLHLRALCRLEAALRDARSDLYESLGSWGRTCCWCCS